MVVPCFGPKVIFALCFGLTLVLSINLTKLSLLNLFTFCFSAMLVDFFIPYQRLI